jgi:CSLREA domain-containing protein
MLQFNRRFRFSQTIYLFTVVLLLFMFLPVSGMSAEVSSIYVNSTEDRAASDPGNGLCDTGILVGDQPECTLRAAIQVANASSGPFEIYVPAGFYQLTLQTEYDQHEDESVSGDLDITDDLHIIGAGAELTVIDGNKLDRVFHVLGPIQVHFYGLTIQNGYAEQDNQLSGGGLLNDGGNVILEEMVVRGNVSQEKGHGIYNHGTLTIKNSLITGNFFGDSFSTIGGGIYNLGSLTVFNSSISSNAATVTNGHGGGIYNNGGDIDIYDSVLDFNAASGGAAIFNSHGKISLTRCSIQSSFVRFTGTIRNYGIMTLSECTVAENFGGIVSYGGLTMTESTFSKNEVDRGLAAISSGGMLVIINSTVSENRTDYPAGAISSSGTLEIINSTIWGNRPGGSEYPGGIAFGDGTATIQGSIVADNGDFNCSGTLTSGGYNLDSDGSCNLSADTDLVGVDPLLGPLADNGGRTWTHALLPGSPAIDAITEMAACTVETDQRGVPRPQGAGCDIGAFELEQAANQPPDCSLASATPDLLWPANNQFVPIQIMGVTDPDGDPIALTVTSIFQDEPVGKKPHAPDGRGIGTAMPEVRAERDGSGDGRVYHISFQAEDSRSGVCTGTVLVGVPHDRGGNSTPVDQGPLYNSVVIPDGRDMEVGETSFEDSGVYLPLINAR